MTGPQLKEWATQQGLDVPSLADRVRKSEATVYNWFSRAVLGHDQLLALAHIGCKPASEALQRWTGTGSAARRRVSGGRH